MMTCMPTDLFRRRNLSNSDIFQVLKKWMELDETIGLGGAEIHRACKFIFLWILLIYTSPVYKFSMSIQMYAEENARGANKTTIFFYFDTGDAATKFRNRYFQGLMIKSRTY